MCSGPPKDLRARVRRIKHSRWALLKNPDNLTAPQAVPIAELEAAGGPLWKAWLLKEDLRELLKLDAGEASQRLDLWLDRVHEADLDEFARIAATIRDLRPEIEAMLTHRLTNGRVESVDAKIRLILIRAFGFHNPYALTPSPSSRSPGYARRCQAGRPHDSTHVPEEPNFHRANALRDRTKIARAWGGRLRSTGSHELRRSFRESAAIRARSGNLFVPECDPRSRHGDRHVAVRPSRHARADEAHGGERAHRSRSVGAAHRLDLRPAGPGQQAFSAPYHLLERLPTLEPSARSSRNNDLARRIGALSGFGITKVPAFIAMLARRFGLDVHGFEGSLPPYGSLSEVLTYDDLTAYQARKHEWKQARAQRSTGVRHQETLD